MNPIDWLCNREREFSDLSASEQDAIMHFTLLWSLFEAQTLDTVASAGRIIELTREWERSGRLHIEPFANCLSYYQRRYFRDGVPTERFCGLNLRRNDYPALVEAVLSGENTSLVDSVGALLIVVLRLRNNLFHGVKWSFGMKGQFENLTNANIVMMAALDTHGESGL